MGNILASKQLDDEEKPKLYNQVFQRYLTYKTVARQLLDKIKENRDVLHWNDKGELVYENKPISGAIPNDRAPSGSLKLG